LAGRVAGLDAARSVSVDLCGREFGTMRNWTFFLTAMALVGLVMIPSGRVTASVGLQGISLDEEEKKDGDGDKLAIADEEEKKDGDKLAVTDEEEKKDGDGDKLAVTDEEEKKDGDKLADEEEKKDGDKSLVA
jgi:hypothetical protein